MLEIPDDLANSKTNLVLLVRAQIHLWTLAQETQKWQPLKIMFNEKQNNFALMFWLANYENSHLITLQILRKLSVKAL